MALGCWPGLLCLHYVTSSKRWMSSLKKLQVQAAPVRIDKAGENARALSTQFRPASERDDENSTWACCVQRH